MYIDIFTDLQIGAKWVLKQGLKWGDTFLVCKVRLHTFVSHKHIPRVTKIQISQV